MLIRAVVEVPATKQKPNLEQEAGHTTVPGLSGHTRNANFTYVGRNAFTNQAEQFVRSILFALIAKPIKDLLYPRTLIPEFRGQVLQASSTKRGEFVKVVLWCDFRST